MQKLYEQDGEACFAKLKKFIQLQLSFQIEKLLYMSKLETSKLFRH